MSGYLRWLLVVAAVTTTTMALGQSIKGDRLTRPSPQPSGKWESVDLRSKKDDSLGIVVAVQARTPLSYHGHPVVPVLAIRCSEREMTLFVDWKQFFGGADGVYVNYRIDKAKSKEAGWGGTTAGSIMGTNSPREAWSFIAELAKGRELWIRGKAPFGDPTLEAEFDISGLSRQLSKLRSRCPSA